MRAVFRTKQTGTTDRFLPAGPLNSANLICGRGIKKRPDSVGKSTINVERAQRQEPTQRNKPSALRRDRKGSRKTKVNMRLTTLAIGKRPTKQSTSFLLILLRGRSHEKQTGAIAVKPFGPEFQLQYCHYYDCCNSSTVNAIPADSKADHSNLALIC